MVEKEVNPIIIPLIVDKNIPQDYVLKSEAERLVIQTARIAVKDSLASRQKWTEEEILKAANFEICCYCKTPTPKMAQAFEEIKAIVEARK